MPCLLLFLFRAAAKAQVDQGNHYGFGAGLPLVQFLGCHVTLTMPIQG